MNYRIGEMEVAPGELKFGSLRVGEMRDGSIVSIPLMVMNGKGKGPVLWMHAAIHGDEIPGIEVIRRVMREELSPKDLKGTIVAAPVLNPFAFRAGGCWTPIYMGTGTMDLHAVFPGNPNGGLNERMAHRIFTEGMLKSDFCIDFHSNFYPAVEFIPVTICEDRQILEASIAMAKAFGLPVSEIKGALGWPVYNAQKAGKPAIVVELLAQGYFDERSNRIGVLGTKNVLRHLGMIEGEIEPLPNLKVAPGLFGRGYIYANHGGLVHLKKDAGDWVETGEVIAIIRDVYGNEVEKVKVPMQGYIRTILFGQHNEALHEGGIVASVLESDPNRKYCYD
jgi:predicted deacylase